ncbi:AGAP002476-PA-like protein [Anopheles sinensis]|uniref:AGAP002476-PA-like protein n=1 Tax=Anopheles sinensis TaxID=74873 RepID=A0A084WRC2_ANOSI|nr:AGAP002476-PA-like protein [Anopheles sinensis]
MDYDSDSELHATDRLRLESDSEDDNGRSSTTPAQEQIYDPESNIVATNPSGSESIEQAKEGSKTSGNEDDQLRGIQSRRTKVSKIIDSDSEDGNVPENTDTPTNKRPDDDNSSKNMLRLKSLLDSDSDSGSIQQENQLKQIPKKKLKKKKGKSRSPPGSAEGETESEDDQNMKGEKDTDEAGVKIKRKKQTKVKNPVNPVATAKDLLAGMTEKQALEERQLIQSESQRMAREAYVDIPYHRTKAYSFEEFLARKTIRKPDPNRDCLEKASDLSIRMTPEQLEIFARQLKERELESQEFFKSESESGDEEPKKGDAPPVEVAEDKEHVEVVAEETQTKRDAEPEEEEVNTPLDANKLGEEIVQDATSTTTVEQNNDPMDEIVNQTSENMETLLTDHHAETQPPEKAFENEIKYDLITAGPNETISSKKASLLATLNLPPCPRLSGHSDMIIDLDSGNIEPKAPTGADILFQRLAKCSGSAKKSPPSKSTITVLSTDDGVVKFNKISLFTEQERPLVHKEPIPGAAFLKLKQTLKEKIDNDRREAMRKREEEYAKKVEIEKAEMGYDTDEEEEELLADEECAEDESEEKSDVAGQQKNDFANDEAMEEELDDEAGANENDDDDDDDETSASSSSSDEDDQSDGAEEEGAVKRKGRIIKAFEDSDDESDANKLLEITPTVLAHTSPNRKEKVDENIAVPWNQDDADNPPEDDLMELCSGRFATQLPTDSTQTLTQNEELTGVGNKECQPITKPLYTQTEQNIGDSQLLELCSGRFETQLPEVDDRQATIGNDSPDRNSAGPLATAVSDSSDILGGGKLCLESSDEETDRGGIVATKKIKKRKRKHIQLSDDDDETNDRAGDIVQEDSDEDPMSDQEKEVGQVGDAEEDEEAERYVDYDSEENEVEVTLTKKDKKRIVANFVENEAELSESEWGSADEDEKDLDRYDVELADEEQFDQKQLQQELEKIHNRQMLDQDNREVEQLKEFFLEDEENDGVGRVRQFRWKNVEKTFTVDYDKQNEGDNENEEGADGNASDEETELAWRKMRHERNMLLKEQNINLNETELSTTTTLLNPDDTIGPTDGQENNQSVGHIGGMAKKKITIVKRTTTASTGKEDSPFLISKCSVVQGHKASFLSRDAETLNKLANLVKSNPETEGSSTVVASKGRNFVFTALSPAIEKTSKRSLDSEDAEERTNIKKAKTASKEFTSKKKLMLGSLM